MFEAADSELTAATTTGRSRPELELTLEALAKLEAHTVERRLVVTAAIDGLDDGGCDGESVTRARAKRSKKAAKKSAKTAAALAKMPKTRVALANGDINEEHADAAAEAAGRVSPEAADDELVGKAVGRPADMFGRDARTWANAREKQAAAKERYERQRADREARMWIDTDGMWCLFARFDPIEGQTVKKAVDRVTDRLWRDDGGRDGSPDDIRTPDQRRADAVAALLSATETATTGPVRRPNPKYLALLRVDASRCRAVDPTGVAEFVDGTPIPQSVLERIACDAEFAGTIFSADGSVLWQGRRTRTATDGQWAALITRDGGCPCCNADPSHCEAHHIKPWAQPVNGPTDIDNMVLVCTQLHHLIHDHGYTIERTNGQWHITPPKRKPNAPPKTEAA